ncbi:hypothetical protein PTKIN_Ptkin03bG0122000 [Pterospermum kingtungense]
MDVKTSPPISIKTVKMRSWELEKTSISTLDILETVAADTEVKNKSKFLGLKDSTLGFKTLSNQKPRNESNRK